MAVDPTPDPLRRATEALKAEDDPGWVEVSHEVVRRVRTLVTPAVAVTVHDPTGSVVHGMHGSTVKLSGRVLTPRLRAAVDTGSSALDALDVDVTDDRCAAIHVTLVCAYGVDLQAEGRRVRDAVAAVARELLGPDPLFEPDRDVTVEVVDVVEGDPRAL